MAYYQDFSKYDIFPAWDMLVAVGWISPLHSFSTGAVASDVVSKLSELLVDPIQPRFHLFMLGRHHCLYCPETIPVAKAEVVNGVKLSIGRNNLFVPAAGKRVFVAPSMIIHYIIAHNYCPPQEFLEAVLSCPPMRSTRYYQEMRTRGATIWSWWTFLRHTH